ncbi:MAG: putative hydrolase superfamily [Dehalococcoidia bacterium]|nr:putative hydrolase superfamily [Dehalococcoidia bacterium]
MAAPLNSVTFDLWQTLILDTPEISRPRSQRRLNGILQVLKQDGHNYAYEDLQRANRSSFKILDAIRDQELKDVTFDEQIDIYIKEVNAALPAILSQAARSAIVREYVDSYMENPPTVDECAVETLGKVRDLGLKMGLICNTGATPGMTQRVFLKQVGIAQFFDILVFSDEERLSKPAPRIFELTLERLSATAAETVHVGDHGLNDVVGAKKAGLRAIWLRRKPEDVPAVAPDVSIDSLRETPTALVELRGA